MNKILIKTLLTFTAQTFFIFPLSATKETHIIKKYNNKIKLENKAKSFKSNNKPIDTKTNNKIKFNDNILTANEIDNSIYIINKYLMPSQTNKNSWDKIKNNPYIISGFALGVTGAIIAGFFAITAIVQPKALKAFPGNLHLISDAIEIKFSK
ncbi:hypothetical protein [Mycoplasma phocimorsus]|uniref:hypothetical protein n=1 Tax=Mycoplasma phocimorsus TaxID=3045839 RepID=UPI0024BF8D46|nr:hypothetical protein [Mycoplasma phocimorsus]MDJ1647166.1 hypothetical protein [Mycoplasma phocimorsus]MDJ1648259.1 hypothetical protein [Mycoplasma phocimorsus]MDJ1648755.1 hypothetical protein [Mycoplasma phocimorsus]